MKGIKYNKEVEAVIKQLWQLTNSINPNDSEAKKALSMNLKRNIQLLQMTLEVYNDELKVEEKGVDKEVEKLIV